MQSKPFQGFVNRSSQSNQGSYQLDFLNLPLDECVDNIKAHEMGEPKAENLIKGSRDKQISYSSEQMPHKSQYQSHLHERHLKCQIDLVVSVPPKTWATTRHNREIRLTNCRLLEGRQKGSTPSAKEQSTKAQLWQTKELPLKCTTPPHMQDSPSNASIYKCTRAQNAYTIYKSFSNRS